MADFLASFTFLRFTGAPYYGYVNWLIFGHSLAFYISLVALTMDMLH